MDRRDFMKAATTLVAAAALHRGDFAQNPGSANETRLVLPMNRGWRYSPSFVEGGHDVNFDDSAFDRVVDSPHKRGACRGTDLTTNPTNSSHSTGRRFKLPPQARGKHVFIDFEGVMTASTVWINGQRLGEYKGGYTPFSVRADATPKS
jgi:beta-galactosidase